jgi:glyoxylase-like metal-dependent hydrolase (beta-lactamase superfamily II)
LHSLIRPDPEKSKDRKLLRKPLCPADAILIQEHQLKSSQIIPVKLGMVNAYIVKQDGVVLIDTGTPGSEGVILRTLMAAGIEQQEVRLILVTHGHGDHAGSASRLQEMTGAPVAVHENDAGMLRTGTQGRLIPTGLIGRIAPIFLGSVNKTTFPAVNPAIVIKGPMDLAPYGVVGTVIPTPGHTLGSVSVVLGNGDVFSGDLIFPQIPSGKPGLPFWADNPADVCRSVRTLLAENPKIFHIGHGGPFPAELVRQMVE